MDVHQRPGTGQTLRLLQGMTVKEFASKHRLRVRQDEDLTDIIPGKCGHIYEYDDSLLGVLVLPHPPRRNYWGFTRRELAEAGCVLVQDGDGEGAATFDPHERKQVKAALRAAWVRKIKVLTPEDRERRATRARTLYATSQSRGKKRNSDV